MPNRGQKFEWFSLKHLKPICYVGFDKLADIENAAKTVQQLLGTITPVAGNARGG